MDIYSAIAAGNGWLNGIVWGVPALVLLMGAGIILTVGLKGFQFRKFGYAMKNTIGKMFDKHEAKEAGHGHQVLRGPPERQVP